MSPSRKTPVIIYCLLLVAVTLAFYNPIIHNQFTGFDDWSYILKNPQVQAGLTWQTVKWSFTTFHEGNWHPLTWLSHAFDYQLFHLNPIGHHYTNLLLHAANAVLLFLLLRRATGNLWSSLLVAFLFALHPVNVESIAWASERKNVLSALFFLLGLHAYDGYARCQRPTERRYLYFAVAGSFVLGLLAKPQIVTFPFVLLLWDYWPLHRIGSFDSAKAFSSVAAIELETPIPAQALAQGWRRLVVEKLPLFFIAAADSIVTIFAQRAGNAVRTISEAPLSQRLDNIPVSYVRYMGKLLWPTRLAPLYPRATTIPSSLVIVSIAILLIVSALVVRWPKRRYLMVGWLWFLGTLVPMIGIVTVGEQAMADRYAYIPYIGLLIAIVLGLHELASAFRISARWRAAPAIAAILIFGILTSRQLKFWHDDETLWRYTLSVTDGNYVAHNNLALMYSKAGRSEEAVVEFRAAKSLHQYPANQILALAFYELRHGHPQEAIEECQSVLRDSKDPKVEAVAYGEIGQAYLQMRQYDLASGAFRVALNLSPDNVMALVGAGVLDLRQGRTGQAVSQLVLAVNNDPSDVNFLLLAQALLRDGRSLDAKHAQTEAKRVSEDLTVAQNTAFQFLTVAGVTPI
jgi:tetratricopeptide (TPR) repeat protein